MPNQLGRRAPKNAPALLFKSFRASGGALPPHPATVDHLARLQDWKVLGNDVAGDCNAVTWANMRRMVTATLSTESYPTQEQVWQFYKTQNPMFDPHGTASTNGPGSNADQGMEIQTGLEYLAKNGGPDGVKPIAFAKVDPSNIEEVEAAISIFGGLWVGVVVLDANMQQFDAGQEWTDVSNSTVQGGHAVFAGGYTPDVRFISWGKETGLTQSFWNGVAGTYRLVEEAWVVIWPEHLGSKSFQAGVDVAALASAYQAVTGKTLVISTPTPPPTPGPAPVPTPAPAPSPDVHVDAADRELAAAAKQWVVAFHMLDNRRMQMALRNWLQAKGF